MQLLLVSLGLISLIATVFNLMVANQADLKAKLEKSDQGD